MNDVQVDGLIRRIDVATQPDPAFVESSYIALLGQLHSARARDATWLGRLAREVRLSWGSARETALPRSITLAALVALLVLALVAGLMIVGALNQPILGGNGLLIVSVRGQLEAVDPDNGSAHGITPADEKAEGASRSPDGRTATFWVNEAGRSRLFAIGVDGRERRELATTLSVAWNPSIDTWSSDSRFLATEVTLNGEARILIVDLQSGAARPVTPAGVVAHSPLWSPDDQWIAFTPETAAGRGLSVIQTDGTGLHDVAGDLHGLDVSGPDTWSPDGQWIYFNAGDSSESHVFRANVPGRFSQQLSGGDLHAAATASSPDGAKIAFIVDAPSGWDLWVAGSDGHDAHRILESAGLGGWSSDGQFILVSWKPPDNKLGGLGPVRPDGTGLTVLIPFMSQRLGRDLRARLRLGPGAALTTRIAATGGPGFPFGPDPKSRACLAFSRGVSVRRDQRGKSLSVDLSASGDTTEPTMLGPYRSYFVRYAVLTSSQTSGLGCSNATSRSTPPARIRPRAARSARWNHGFSYPYAERTYTSFPWRTTQIRMKRLDLSADPGLTLAIYSAEAGSGSEDALRELDRWSSTRAKLTAAEA
jgi:Tol biopolymer transport system component